MYGTRSRNHCQMLIRSYKQQQKEYEGWAQQYEKLAKEAGGTAGKSEDPIKQFCAINGRRAYR